jgi:hypothetical protein
MTELTEGSTGQHTITIHLVVRGADRAANWYVQTLGAVERGRVPVPDGRFMQIELRFGDSTVMIADEFPEIGVVSPLTVGGVYSALSIHTDDVEALWSGRCRQAPRSFSRSRTCSGATAMARSSIPSATSGRSHNTSKRFPLRR